MRKADMEVRACVGVSDAAPNSRGTRNEHFARGVTLAALGALLATCQS